MIIDCNAEFTRTVDTASKNLSQQNVQQTINCTPQNVTKTYMALFNIKISERNLVTIKCKFIISSQQ